MTANLIDWEKVSKDDRVIKLIKDRELIEKQIRDIDEMALVRYMLEKLNLEESLTH